MQGIVLFHRMPDNGRQTARQKRRRLLIAEDGSSAEGSPLIAKCCVKCSLPAQKTADQVCCSLIE